MYLCSVAGSRDEIDQYNEKTIDLLVDLDSCLLRANYAIDKAESIGYDYGKAYALYLKGYIHRVQDDLGKAFLANLEGLNVLKSISDERAPETLVMLYLNTGEILKKHFKYEEANKYYFEGLKIAKGENLTTWIIKLTYNIGNAYRTKGDLEKATEFIQQAYDLAKKEKDEYTIINALNLMGLISKDNYNHDKATLFFNKMLDYQYASQSADKYKGRAYHNLANTHAQAGDTINAIAAFHEALKYKKIRNKPNEVFITENDMAELFYLQGDYKKARRIVLNCIEHYQDIKLDPDYYKIFDLARKINAELSEYQLADHYADRYFEENQKFIEQQEKLIEIRDQFKMEVLTASFFVDLERNKQIANLNIAIISILIFSVIIISYLKIKQTWIKSVVGKELDKLVRE